MGYGIKAGKKGCGQAKPKSGAVKNTPVQKSSLSSAHGRKNRTFIRYIHSITARAISANVNAHTPMITTCGRIKLAILEVTLAVISSPTQQIYLCDIELMRREANRVT